MPVPEPGAAGLLAIALALALGYVLGSIPSAQLMARTRGKDIFATGSGNMGTMNALRHVSPLVGVLTLLLDVAKGAAAVLLAPLLAQAIAPGAEWVSAWSVAAAAFGAGLGHAWSLFARFRGGKALAVCLGVLLPHHWLIGIGGLLLIAILALLLRNTNLASIISVILAAAAVWYSVLSRHGPDPVELAFPVAVLLLVILIIWRHLVAPPRRPVTASVDASR